MSTADWNLYNACAKNDASGVERALGDNGNVNGKNPDQVSAS